MEGRLLRMTVSVPACHIQGRYKSKIILRVCCFRSLSVVSDCHQDPTDWFYQVFSLSMESSMAMSSSRRFLQPRDQTLGLPYVGISALLMSLVEAQTLEWASSSLFQGLLSSGIQPGSLALLAQSFLTPAGYHGSPLLCYPLSKLKVLVGQLYSTLQPHAR